LSYEAAALLGQPSGIAVLPAQPDGALIQIGSEAESGSVMTLSLGTSGALRLASSKPWLSPSRSTWLYRSPTSFLVGAATSGCTNCLDWFKEQAYGSAVSYRQIEQNLVPGNSVPVFLPFLVGERCPLWQDTRRASFHDIESSTTKDDLYLAVLEGVLANLYQCYEKVQESGLPISTIRLSGGVLNSALWKQMCCNYFGHQMEEDAHQHASLYGSLVLAARSQGVDLFAHPTHERTVLTPSDVLHQQYQAHYQRYLHWYQKTAH
ncbi:MAG: FGGY-family carbohydrate kinase, partial [Erysipelotrichaceae bacterium]|nr:FGGY-family carbohydrate kinase [Erysipelotrichaceae bacterium]